MELSEFADMYVAMWNEPDPKLRRETIERLWAFDGTQILQSPQEIKAVAKRLGMATPALVAHGHDALEARVSAAHREFVASGQMEFRMEGLPQRVGDAVKLRWIAVPPGGGEKLGGGIDIFLLDAAGQIKTQYQFIDG